MDTDAQIALSVIAVALAVSLATFVLLGRLLWHRVRRMYKRLEMVVLGKSNHTKNPVDMDTNGEHPVLLFQPTGTPYTMTLRNTGQGMAQDIHVSTGWQVVPDTPEGVGDASYKPDIIPTLLPGDHVVLRYTQETDAGMDYVRVECRDLTGRSYLAEWRGSWTRFMAKDATGYPGTSTPTPEEHSLWWIWTFAGLIIGTCVGLLVKRSSHSAQSLDPAEARERLFTVYNPLLMLVNELPLSDSDVDSTVLAEQYRDKVRPLLYTYSHLLSRRLLDAAARADTCMAGAHTDELVGRLRTLRAQVRTDHQRLQKESTTRRSTGTDRGIAF